MEWFFGPTIPSWNIVLQCLPKEYKDRNVVSGDKAQLFDENVTEGTSQDPNSKINILLTKRQLFFFRRGILNAE